MHERIICALVGLIGAVSNNGKTENTDGLILRTLSICFNDKIGDAEVEQVVSQINREKRKIAPDCATCSSPCGNTDDYDIDKFRKNDEIISNAKISMLQKAAELAGVLIDNGVEIAPEIICKAIAFFSYDLFVDSYEDLEKKLSLEQKRYEY